MPQNPHGKWMCWRRKKGCDPKKGGCGHRFTPEEYDLWECPECGHDRHCRWPVDYEGQACKFHGGNAPKGMAHPNFKHGGYSQYMPRDLIPRYEEFLEDPNRLALEHEMSVIRALISERVQALNEVNSAEAWGRLNKVYNQMMSASRQKQKARFASLLVELGEIISVGLGPSSTREEIRKLTETERRLVDTQRQLYIDLGEFITRGMALTMFGNFMEAVKEHVQKLDGGQKALTSIAATIAGMAGSLRKPGSVSGGGETVEGDYRVAE